MNLKNELFASAGDCYGALGVDVEKAMAALDTIQLGIHAWQGDDIRGFEKDSFTLTGGCPLRTCGVLVRCSMGKRPLSQPVKTNVPPAEELWPVQRTHRSV